LGTSPAAVVAVAAAPPASDVAAALPASEVALVDVLLPADELDDCLLEHAVTASNVAMTTSDVPRMRMKLSS
jgi:hypothetical protein